jgi:hypothetical protein
MREAETTGKRVQTNARSVLKNTSNESNDVVMLSKFVHGLIAR